MCVWGGGGGVSVCVGEGVSVWGGVQHCARFTFVVIIEHEV